MQKVGGGVYVGHSELSRLGTKSAFQNTSDPGDRQHKWEIEYLER